MNEDWDRAKRIVADALEVDCSARGAAIEAGCGNDGQLLELVKRLLRAHDNARGFMMFETPFPGVGSLLDSPESEPSVIQDDAGSAIGPYRLLSVLGQGGMGEVWRAQQTQPVERHVALKIIKLGMDTEQVVARFNAERQALAVMDHPNIAKVFDAGSTPRGRPYFAMELIDGVPITR